jgi:hypothetical protein
MPRAVLGGTDAGGCRDLGSPQARDLPGRNDRRDPVDARARTCPRPPAEAGSRVSAGSVVRRSKFRDMAPPINRVQFVVFRHVLLDVATRYRRPKRTESAPRQAGPAPARLASTTELPR